MFEFFFIGLYQIPEIYQAFEDVCTKKMLFDGYFDMNVFLSCRYKKEDILNQLQKESSNFSKLYAATYPDRNNTYSFWTLLYGTRNVTTQLTSYESFAIVYWVYKLLKSDERSSFTIELFKKIKSLHNIKHNIQIKQGVVFNTAKIDIRFIASMKDFLQVLSNNVDSNKKIFYRGQSRLNFFLEPSVMRTQALEQSESNMYRDLLINCPQNFEKCHSHLEKLVEMQHYGLPTRLLDITRNPLVALYFACCDSSDFYGELILISVQEREIRNPQSDSVSILASLPAFSYATQEEFFRHANDASLSKQQLNVKLNKLLQEVRTEKPAFQSVIEPRTLTDNYIVYAIKNNNRIIKQDGAFILCGLKKTRCNLGNFRHEVNNKKLIIVVKNKAKILKELDALSINRAALFPEIEEVSIYIKEKYMA